jgi:hypothetical protein
LRDIIDIILKVKANTISIEAANPRHEHEWRVWEEVKLPAGKVLVPGVVGHATDIVEHPQAIADRLVRYAKIVGRKMSWPAPTAASAQSRQRTNLLGEVRGDGRRRAAGDKRVVGEMKRLKLREFQQCSTHSKFGKWRYYEITNSQNHFGPRRPLPVLKSMASSPSTSK